MKLPTISVIFPNLNGSELLEKLLTSISSQNYDKKKIETIMIDNGSTDNSVEVVAKNFPKVKIIALPKNLGFATAVNLGIKKSKASYIFVTNNDVVLDKNCFLNLTKFVQKDPKIGVTGPAIFENNSQKPIQSLKYNFYTGLFKKSDKLTASDWITGAGMFFSKKLWRNLAGFDEGFFFTFEDLDFCLRVKKTGFKIISHPKAVMWHIQGATVNRPEFRQQLKYFEGYKAKLRLLLKHGNLVQIMTAFFLQFFVFAPYRFVFLREKSLIPLLQALIWNFKNLPKTLQSRGRLSGSFIK